jgi:hypothetical protein
MDPDAEGMAVWEYVGKFPNTVSVHGNATRSTTKYVRTSQKVMNKASELVETMTPREIYTKMVTDGVGADGASICEVPRDMKQIENLKYRKAKESRVQSDGVAQSRNNNADDIQSVLSSMHDHPFIQEVVQQKGKPPMIVLYTEDQIRDIISVCDTGDKYQTVIGIDRTFNLGACYVTTLAYKNTKVLRKTSGEAPVLAGPMFLHWDGEFSAYQRFLSHFQSLLCNPKFGGKPDMKKLVFGSDEEQAIMKSVDNCFCQSTLCLCTLHLEKNLKLNLASKVGVNDKQKSEISQEIFGPSGLIASKDLDEFDQKTIALVIKLGEVSEWLASHVEHRVAPNIQKYVVAPRLQHPWLPVGWTNNNCESVNHVFKMVTKWKTHKMPELIKKLYSVVQVQSIDLRRAIHGQGNYELHPRVSKLGTTHAIWKGKSDIEQNQLYKKFLMWRPRKQTMVVSTDGKLAIPKTPTTAKKPGQRRRPRAEKSCKK